MFYVLDENHNLIEAYDKEGVLAVLAQAIADGSLSGISEDAGFVSKLKCCVTGGTNKVAFVTQAQYNELNASGSILENCLYFITDDATAEGIDEALEKLTDTVNGMLYGTQTVGNATNAKNVKGESGSYYNLSFTASQNGASIDTNYFEKGKLYAVDVAYFTDSQATARGSGLFWFIMFGTYYNRIPCGERILELSESKGIRLLDSTGSVLTSGSVNVRFVKIGDLSEHIGG